MTLTNHDIEHEKKLIRMLGFDLIGPDKFNRWDILKNGNEVGYIQYEKLFKKNKKLGYPATYTYHMVINSPEISYDSIRRTTTKDGKEITDNKFSYGFEIKRENGDIDKFVMHAGKYPHLELWSIDYGYMRFSLNFEGLYLSYKSRTDNFNVEETLIFKDEEENIYNHAKEYSYIISYCDKNIDVSDNNMKGIKTREISGLSTLDEQEFNLLRISEKSWINHKIWINRENIVTGSVEDMITKHKIGIETFNHFRYLINKILPFKEEVISSLLKEKEGNRNVIKTFLPDLYIEEKNKGTQKIKK